MNILGWVVRPRITYSFVFFILNTTSVAGLMQPQQAPSAQELVSFTQTLLDTMTSLPYASAQELVVTIPHLNYDLTINWGFGGSGSIFEALPSAPVTVKPSTQTLALNTPFSMTTLGEVLVKDGLMQQAHKFPLLQWISDKQLNPAKLFFLKFLLLMKDYKRDLYDLGHVRAELTRLIIRLSLAADSSIAKSTKNLSSMMPSFIKDFVASTAPEVIAVMDTLWAALKDPNIAMDDAPSILTYLPRTVHAVTFKDKATADTYFDLLSNNSPDRITRGTDVQVFKGLSTVVTPAGMPAELKTEVLNATTLPALVRAESNGEVWIGYVTDRLDAADTLKMFAVVVFTTIKKYAAERNHYFKLHPHAAQEAQSAYASEQQKAQRIHAFLNTEEGKESVARLAEAVEALRTEQTTEKKPSRAQEMAATLQMLKAQQNQAAAQVDLYNKQRSWWNGREMNEKISALQKTIDARQRTIELYQNQLEQWEATQSPATLEANLQELYRLAAQLKNNGQPVPAELTTMISDLEGQLDPKKQILLDAGNQHVIALIEYRDAVAKIYEQEAKQLMRNAIASYTQRRAVANNIARRAAEIEFDTLIKPMYTAYCVNLHEKATALRAENTKMLELVRIRNIVKTHGLNSLDTEQKKTFFALESEVGWIIDNRPSEGFMQNLLLNNDAQELLNNIFSDKNAYKEVREYFNNALGLILQKSDHVRSAPATYWYLLSKIAPTFLPTFEHIMNSPAQAA